MPARDRRFARSAATLGAAAALLALSACSSSVVDRDARVAAAQIRRNPSPAMADLDERNIDIRNRRAYIRDTNFRQLREDLQYFWHQDRPSRLSSLRGPY